MATISENLQIIKNSVNNIKNAILSKGGIIKGNITSYGEAIVNLPSGGVVNPTASKNDVTFYDYDGTIRYSYTAEEFLALTEMPPLPTQPGLICQGWNSPLDEAQEYVSKYGILNIGALYTTYDGKTRLYIRVTVNGMDVPLYFTQTITHGVIVDWGDSSATETLDGIGVVNTAHHYNSVGDYVISLDIVEGCRLGLGQAGVNIFGGAEKASILKKLEIGDSAYKLNGEALSNCTSLSEITLPSHIFTNQTGGAYFDLDGCVSLKFVVVNSNISLDESNFEGCTALSCVALPADPADKYGSISGFRNCTSLESIIIPSRFSHIGFHAFLRCSSLKSIVLVSTIKRIHSSSFYGCTSMKFYDFSHHTAVPTLADVEAFRGIPSDCKIIVPDNLYDTWIAATNWATYSTNIIKKTDWDNQQ
jgi:hypothetical protein